MAPPAISIGFGLLLATRPVRIGHPVHEELRAGDLAVVDRQVPVHLAGETGWTAQLLDLGSHLYGIDRRTDRIGKALDGAAPLATLIKTLWTVGEGIDRMAVADDMTDPRMIGLIGGLASRLLTDRRCDRMAPHSAMMIERAESIIAAHLADPTLSSATLAAHMGISQRHLASLFAAAGTTATKAILRHRLARARSLLADPVNGRRPIASIGRLSGFEDQNYFSRCFRRDTGMTPRQFRSDVAERRGSPDPEASNCDAEPGVRDRRPRNGA